MRLVLEVSARARARRTWLDRSAIRAEPLFQVKASKEVILSAGAVKSPHILLHSGIGPAAELAQFSVPLIKDLPEVGKNMQDHSLVFGDHVRLPFC